MQITLHTAAASKYLQQDSSAKFSSNKVANSYKYEPESASICFRSVHATYQGKDFFVNIALTNGVQLMKSWKT